MILEVTYEFTSKIKVSFGVHFHWIRRHKKAASSWLCQVTKLTVSNVKTDLRFDQINDEFQQLMNEMSKQSNVVIATNVTGLPEQLEGIQSKLSLCEKALAEYLETKRLAFPRFYFASSADLLDILSNSDYPLKVAKHLTKLFDSMAKLTMEDEGSKLAIAMTAKV